MSERTREYHRQLVLACLARSAEPVTAGDLAEHAATVAQMEGHPREAWAGLNPQAVTGHLRSLYAAGSALQAGTRRSVRNGRDEPLWRFDPRAGSAAVPFPPEDDEPAAAPARAAASPYDNLSREQLVALLSVHDDLAGAMARFRAELDRIGSEARARLTGLGLELPT